MHVISTNTNTLGSIIVGYIFLAVATFFLFIGSGILTDMIKTEPLHENKIGLTVWSIISAICIVGSLVVGTGLALSCLCQILLLGIPIAVGVLLGYIGR